MSHHLNTRLHRDTLDMRAVASLIHNPILHCSEAEYIAERLIESQKRKPRPGPSVPRRFSWEA